jgi:hypothetical protein
MLGKTRLGRAGVIRQTCREWRRQHQVFMAELERRRAEVWRQPQERLRSLLSKAVENLAAVDEGDLKASIEVLKAVGMCGEGTMNAIHGQDPERLIHEEAARRVRAEGISENPTQDMLIGMTTNPTYQRRLAEVTEELYQAYGEVESAHEGLGDGERWSRIEALQKRLDLGG